MFNDHQIKSYHNITTPADLRNKVQLACKNTGKVKRSTVEKTVYRIVPIAACLVLFFSIVSFTIQENNALDVRIGDTVLNSQSVTLSWEQSTTPRMQPFSVASDLRTLYLSVNKDVEILSADGSAAYDDGFISWTILTPSDDNSHKLTLQSGEKIYCILLQYQQSEHCFTIRCEAL